MRNRKSTIVTESKPFNLFDSIIAYETGDIDEDGVLELFQHLVNNGMAWTLQGHYGRTASAMIANGLITHPNAN